MKYEEAVAKYESILTSGKSILDLDDDETIIISMFKLEKKLDVLNAKRKSMRGIPQAVKDSIKAERKAFRKALIEEVNEKCVNFVKDALANVKTDNSEEKLAVDEERKVIRASIRRAKKSLGIEAEEETAEPVDEDVAELLDDEEPKKEG